jgi:hypothetical protein
LFEVVKVVTHATLQGAWAFGFFSGEPRQCQGREVRVVVDESHDPTLRTPQDSSRDSSNASGRILARGTGERGRLSGGQPGWSQKILWTG